MWGRKGLSRCRAQQMLKELPVTLACLSSGRMSEKKLTFLEASGGEKTRADASHTPTA